MRLLIAFITLTSLSLQAMEQLENITVNLKNDQQISISPEQHKLLCRLSQTYADITQDTEKELGTTQIITLNNIPEESFSFIKKHLKQLSQLGNPTPQNDDKKAFETLKTDFNEQSDHRRKSIKQIVTYLDLPKTNFPPYLHGGQIHMYHCRDVKSIINQYIFSDRSKWPLITKITNDLINDLITKTLKGHTDSSQCLTVSPDNRLISGSHDDTIKIWNLKTHTCIATLEGHTDWIRCLALTANSRLISGSDDKTIKIWNLKTHTCIATLKDHNAPVICLTISPDNSRLFSSSYKIIKIWDLETHTCIATLKDHTDWIRCLALTPDNNRLISGSADGDIKIWDLNTHTCIATLEGHTGRIRCLALTSDNSRLISGSDDKTIKIWDLNTHSCIATLKDHNAPVICLTISPDNRLISGSFDRTIKIWDLEKIKEVKEKLDQLSICDVAILKIIQDKITQSEWSPNLCKKANSLGASPTLLELLGQQKTPTKKDNVCCLIQ